MDEVAAIEGEVVKASPAIQIQNNITLLQRKAWNVLLFHAYDNLLSQERHEISIQELKRYLGYNSKDDEYLKEIIRAMMSCIVEWNLLRKDGDTQWGASTLLSAALIKSGTCSYEYSSILRERLYNPRMYARLSLSLQNNFKSKHAQALWELCLDYLGSSREHGETPYIELETFKKLMGIEEGAYPSYKRLSEKVLRPAVAEINKVSDLRVTVDYQRKGRKVMALKFKIRRELLLPSANPHQHSLFPDLDDMPVVVKMLKDAGLADHDAWEVWQKGFEYVNEDKRPVVGDDDPQAAFLDYVREKIHLLKMRQENRQDIANPAGFVLSAIRENYGNPQFEKQQAAAEKAEKTRLLQRLEREREKMIRNRDDALQTLSNQVVELEGQADKAFAALREQGGSAFESWYDADKSALENYHAHHGLAVSVGKWLEEQFPVQFGEVRQRFDRPLAEIESQISVLEAEGISTKYLS